MCVDFLLTASLNLKCFWSTKSQRHPHWAVCSSKSNYNNQDFSLGISKPQVGVKTRDVGEFFPALVHFEYKNKFDQFAFTQPASITATATATATEEAPIGMTSTTEVIATAVATSDAETEVEVATAAVKSATAAVMHTTPPLDTTNDYNVIENIHDNISVQLSVSSTTTTTAEGQAAAVADHKQ